VTNSDTNVIYISGHIINQELWTGLGSTCL